MNLPRGELVRSRVVTDPATALASVLERRLSGYAVFEPQDSLLLDADGHGILVFESGVPTVAYHTGTHRGGPTALADLAVPGPYSIDLFRLVPGELDAVETTDDCRVPPGMPAERLAGNPELASRTRERAPAECHDAESNDPTSAVEAFLEDDAKIDAIRQQAREEARRRAEEWGLDDQLQSAPKSDR